MPSTACLAVLVMTACSAPSHPDARDTARADASSSSSASAGTTSPTSTPAGGLTRYGARVEAWDATHQKVPGKESSYLPLVDGGHPSYDYVLTDGGRVLFYVLRFRDGTDLATARARVLEEFPADVRVERVFDDDADCVILDLRSAAVEAEVGPGVLQVELHSEGATAFRADDVAVALFAEPLDDDSELARDPFC